ncbi:MAG: M6 family metalloprotease domain-containing protein [Gemmatimonadaceae bacterium]|nr:M6 family metalloprotease domain-containing protein [Gemmatimonadaceae bacterium]
MRAAHVARHAGVAAVLVVAVRVAVARVAAALVAGVLLVAAASPGMAQDIEARAAMMGRTLPQAYYDRIARDPRAFEFPSAVTQRARLLATFNMAYTGTIRMLVIPALFADSEQPRASVAAPELQRLLFDGPPSRTVSGFYSEVSGGRLVLDGHVANWVPTALTISEVTGTSMGLGGNARVGEWLKQAVAAADPAIDFRQYDNNGPDGIPDSGDDDGQVDVAAFLFHEMEASCGGPGIWPHRAGIAGWGNGPAVTSDTGFNGQPIIINGYMVQGATECGTTSPMQPNVIAHEFGHVLGLPDYYDMSGGILREQRVWVVGCWELMSAGSWGCGSGPKGTTLTPPHMGPYPKALLGWVTPTIVPAETRDREFVLRPVRTSGDVLRVPLSASQYLLLEYRDRGGFDAVLPAAGVLAYRVEPARNWLPCPTCARTWGYSLIEADANAGLTRTEFAGGNRGEAGDVFRTGAITGATTPSLTLHGGGPTTVSIHSIVIDAAAGVARVRLTNAAAPLIATASTISTPQLVPSTAEVRATGGTEPYTWTVQGALPAGLTLVSRRDRAVFEGSPRASGAFPLTLGLRDARGVTTSQAVTLTVTPAPVISASAIVRALRGGGGLTAAEASYLDAQGNNNGRLDVGDARLYLLRTRTP